MGDGDHGRPDSRVFGKGQQKRFVAHEKFQNAREEPGLGGRVAQRLRPEARNGEEAAQMIRFAGDETQRLDGDSLRFLRRQSIVSSCSHHLFAFLKRIPVSLFTNIRGTGC